MRGVDRLVEENFDLVAELGNAAALGGAVAAAMSGQAGDGAFEGVPYGSCPHEACTNDGYRKAVESCLEARGYRTVVWR